MMVCETIVKTGVHDGDVASRLASRDQGTAVLLVGPGSSPRVFRARKSVLAANSAEFRRIWPDATARPHLVTLPDMHPDIFSQLLKYWYKGEVQLSTLAEAFQLLEATKKYGAESLADHCRRFVTAAVNPRTVCEVLEQAREVDEPTLVAVCCSLLRSHTSAVLQQESFLEASPTLVAELLDEDSLAVASELDLVRAVDRWTTAESRRRGLPSRRHLATPLLHKIVFLSLTAPQFVMEESLRELLTAEEYRDILANIVQLGSCPMPAGFSDRLSRSCRPCVKSRMLADKENLLTLCPNCNKLSCCLLSKTYNARQCHLCHVVVL